MKNSYGSRLRKNNRMREKNIEERTKNVYPLSHYINNGKKLNINSGFNKVEIKKRGIYYINQNSNLLLNSYNQSIKMIKKWKMKLIMIVNIIKNIIIEVQITINFLCAL